MRGELLYRIYTVVKLYGGRANSRRIADVMGVSERTVQRYLKVLVNEGYVEPIRHGMKIFYRVIAPLTREKAKKIAAGELRRDAPVYELARDIQDTIKEFRLHADLIGAAKIHLMVPTHRRITHDIDVIVAPESEHFLVKLLENIHGLILEKARSAHADYRLMHPVLNIKVDIMVEGFKEHGRMIWKLSDILRKRGTLTLEHAIIAKLTRRSFEYRTDAYDVAVSLPHIDPSMFKQILKELNKENPIIASRIPRHLDIVEKYIKTEYVGEDVEILLGLLKRLRD